MRSDAELIDRIRRAGDEAAFRELYRRHAPWLYRLHLRLAGGRVADAEDALQETWIRAMHGLETLADFAKLGAWLKAVAVNVFRERARTELRRLHLLTASDPPPDRVEPVTDAAGVDLERAILGLPTGYRTVLLLHDVEGHTHAEIAKQLAIAVGTSKSQLAAARRALRRTLDDESREARDVSEG